MVGVFKTMHPEVYGIEVYGIEDVGWMIAGRDGREVLGLGFALCRLGSLPSGNCVERGLINGSLDVRCGVWYAGYFYRTQLAV